MQEHDDIQVTGSLAQGCSMVGAGGWYEWEEIPLGLPVYWKIIYTIYEKQLFLLYKMFNVADVCNV